MSASFEAVRSVVGGPGAERSRATVFGLDVHVDRGLSFLERGAARPTGRKLEISLASSSVPNPAWPRSAAVLCDQRERDGSVCFRIEADPTRGYRIWGPAHGSHFLSGDGRSLVCAQVDRDASGWQRLLIAQVLPFAALLQGLEVFHASAVVKDGVAVAFLGRSGSGKTSVACELSRRGASFLADDVLALERHGRGLLAHPGTRLAALDHEEAQRLARAGGKPHLRTVELNVREQIVRMDGAAAPAPLSRLFVLERRPQGPERPHFQAAADTRVLLGATFNAVLDGSARLRRLLDVCALAAAARVERVLLGATVDAGSLADEIERRLEGSR